MKKFTAVLAALLFFASAASADFLEIADRAPDGEAAAALEGFVYESGAAREPRAEERRIAIYNYMLNRDKQKLDNAQRELTKLYENEGERPELEPFASRAELCAQKAAVIQAEIERNDAYVSRLNSDKTAVMRAEKLAAALPTEKTRKIRLAVDAAAVAVLAVAAAAVLFALRCTGTRSAGGTQHGRDCLRLLSGGRYIIAASAAVCCVAAWIVSATVGTGVSADFALPESTGEYLTDIEALDSLAQANSGSEGFALLRKYEIASAYAQILNERAAKNIDALLKTYSDRAEAARTKAENLWVLAWREQNAAETGPEKDFIKRLENCVEYNLLAADELYDAEFCENMALLMSDESIVPSAEANKRAEAAVKAVKTRMLEAARAEREARGPQLPPELWAAMGLLAGGVLAASLVLIAGRVRLEARLRKEKAAVRLSRYGSAMDDVNFRG